MTGAAPLAVFNENWAGLRGLVHGVATRAALPAPGRPAMDEAVAALRKQDVIPVRMPAWGAGQIHGETIRVAGASDPLSIRNAGAKIYEFAECDSLVAGLPGALLIIRTADCLPLFLIDSKKKRAALAHCGWRSMALGLAGKTAAELIGGGSRPEDVQAWIGPCIRCENYEVGAEIAGQFEARWPGAGASPNGLNLDLAAVARHQLTGAGLAPGSIDDCGACTFGNETLYHSYRRDGGESGRLVSFLGWNVN